MSSISGEILKEANRRYGVEITAETVDCFSDGEQMDLHMVVDALMTCGGPIGSQ